MLDKWDELFLFRKKLVLPKVYEMMRWLSAVTYTCAFFYLLAAIYEYGFRISISQAGVIHAFFQGVWGVFLLYTTLKWVVGDAEGRSRTTVWTVVQYVLLYLTLVPVVFHLPEPETGVRWVWLLFHHPVYRGTVLTLLSLSQLSGGLVRLLGRRTNPSVILACSFLVLIFVGSGLLMLPEFTVDGIHWTDAFFTATSATCVTGLSTVDVSQVFTEKGQTLLLVLIQVGGLGVMTLTSFFAMFFMGRTSLSNQLMVGDMISSNSLNSLLSTLLYILGFTLVIEGVGAALIWTDIHGTLGMSPEEELWFSAFHSVSAFCNAGFSTLPGGLGHPQVMQGHLPLYLVISALVLLGGIGFPVLVNLQQNLAYFLRWLCWRVGFRRGHFQRQVHRCQLNTKIVLVMSALLLVAGTLAIVALEWHRSLEGLPVAGKWVHAFFNAVCPRTAGFNSVSFLDMSAQTLLIMGLLMLVGGGTQSTAGGVKMNVVAVIFINLWAVVRGASHATVFRRELSPSSISRCDAAFLLYLLLFVAGVLALSMAEPEASLRQVSFECLSALSTVGSTLDLTPRLGGAGKGIVILLMFIGRVGAFTLASGLIRQEKQRNYRYPSDTIIIN
ncbi:MAG: potassium transporter TrkG [Bacteroidales bacterium]|nr:potassium transporter TrkG [Bacteroidales bacterium]